MKSNKLIVVFSLLFLISVGLAFAQTTRALKTGYYAADGTNLTMQLRSDGNMSIYVGRHGMSGDWAAGTYRISGDGKMVTLSFTRSNGSLTHLRNMNFAYTIINNEMFVNNVETWIFTGN